MLRLRRKVNALGLALGLWSALIFRRKVNGLGLGLGLWSELRLRVMVSA